MTESEARAATGPRPCQTMPLIALLQRQDKGDLLRAVAEAVLQTRMEHDVKGMIGAGCHERASFCA